MSKERLKRLTIDCVLGRKEKADNRLCLFHQTTAVLDPAENGSADSRLQRIKQEWKQGLELWGRASKGSGGGHGADSSLLWLKQEWKKGLDVWGRAYKGLGRRRKLYLVGGEKEVGVTIEKVFKLTNH